MNFLMTRCSIARSGSVTGSIIYIYWVVREITPGQANTKQMRVFFSTFISVKNRTGCFTDNGTLLKNIYIKKK